jgi:Flp pilus assembly pilin Flp
MEMIRNLARRLVRDERGAALAEYAAIFLVLATAGTVILLTVGDTLAAAGTAIDTWLNTNVVDRFTAANGG